MSHAIEDRVESLGHGHAVSLFLECVKQASMFMPRGLSKGEISALHMEWFNNLCALASVLPAYVLNIGLTGSFWHEIEKTLEGGH